MRRDIQSVTVVVWDYDEAIEYFSSVLDLVVVEDQTGGRVFRFLNTDDLDRDYRLLKERGVAFVRPPQVFDYGTAACFRAPSGPRVGSARS